MAAAANVIPLCTILGCLLYLHGADGLRRRWRPHRVRSPTILGAPDSDDGDQAAPWPGDLEAVYASVPISRSGEGAPMERGHPTSPLMANSAFVGDANSSLIATSIDHAASSDNPDMSDLMRVAKQFKTDLVADFHEVASMLSQRDTAAMISRPYELAGLLFAILFVARYFIVCNTDWPEARKVDRKRQKMAKAQQTFFRGPAHDMAAQLSELKQSLPYLAEQHFHERHRDLVRFLHEVARNKRLSHSGGVLLEPFQGFLRQWLEAFEQCTLEPDRKPLILCSSDKLDHAKSLAGLARTVSESALDKMPQLANSDVQAANKLHREISKAKQQAASQPRTQKAKAWVRIACGARVTWRRRQEGAAFPLDIYFFCLRFSLVSVSQAGHFWSFLFGICLSVLLHILGRHFTGLSVDVALVLLISLLGMGQALDETQHVEEELAQLASLKKQVEETRTRITSWQVKYSRVRNLWQYQTVHKLDLFANVAPIIQFPKGGSRDGEYTAEQLEPVRNVLKSLNTKLQVVVDGMGPTLLYMDAPFCNKDVMLKAADQMKRSIELISEAADLEEFGQLERHLDSFFGLLIVRMQAAKDLPNTDGGVLFSKGDLTDPYVVLRLSNTKRENAPSTRVISNCLNPSWEEEFCLPVRDESHVTFEVFDCDEDKWLSANNQGIGFVRVTFRGSPGQWISKKENLRSITYGKQMASKLEYQYFFAECIKHLAMMDGQTDQAKKAFMGIDTFLKVSS